MYAPGRRLRIRRAVPCRLSDDGNPHDHRRVIEADISDRDRFGLPLRGSDRCAVGLAGTVDLSCRLGRSELPAADEVMAGCELNRSERPRNGKSG